MAVDLEYSNRRVFEDGSIPGFGLRQLLVRILKPEQDLMEHIDCFGPGLFDAAAAPALDEWSLRSDFRGGKSILYFREITGDWVDLRAVCTRRQSWRAAEVHATSSANRSGNSTLKSSSFSVLGTPFGGCAFLNIPADMPIEGYPDSPGVGLENPGETAWVHL